MQWWKSSTWSSDSRDRRSTLCGHDTKSAKDSSRSGSCDGGLANDGRWSDVRGHQTEPKTSGSSLARDLRFVLERLMWALQARRRAQQTHRSRQITIGCRSIERLNFGRAGGGHDIYTRVQLSSGYMTTGVGILCKRGRRDSDWGGFTWQRKTVRLIISN